jgi:hypothetical protein
MITTTITITMINMLLPVQQIIYTSRRPIGTL